MTGENKTLNQRIHAVMKEVAYIQKDPKAIDGKYRAITHDAVVAKVRPALVKHGILVYANVTEHSIEREWENVKEYKGKKSTIHYTMTVATVEVTFENVDNPEDKKIVTAFGYGIDNQDKGAGKAISYAVKYAVVKALFLETGEDPDQDQGDDYNQKSVPRSSKPAQPNPPQEQKPSQYKKFLNAMVEMRKKLGDEVYYNVLGEYGHEHANQVGARPKQAKIYKAMEAELERQKQTSEANAEQDEEREAIQNENKGE